MLKDLVETGVPGFLKMYPSLLTVCTTPEDQLNQGLQDVILLFPQQPCVQSPFYKGVRYRPQYSVPPLTLTVQSPCTPVQTSFIPKLTEIVA